MTGIMNIAEPDSNDLPAIPMLQKDNPLELTNKITDGTNVKTAASDVLPVWYPNVGAAADYTSVLAAEITEIDMTLASHGKMIAPSALVVSCAGQVACLGFLVSINTSSTSSAATALSTALPPNTANVAHHKDAYFIPAGETVLIPYNKALGLIHVLAIDTDGAESNVIQVAPL